MPLSQPETFGLGKSILLGIAAVLLLAAAAEPDELYRPRPAEAYEPAAYCDWNRTGLPERFRRICVDRDRKAQPKLYRPRPGENPTALLSDCKIDGPISCNNDIFQKVWLQISDAAGAEYKINMNSIAPTAGNGARVVIYYVEDGSFKEQNLDVLQFDCRGNYLSTSGRTQSRFAAPKSVVGIISTRVCADAELKRAEIQSGTQASSPPSSVDYCSGFTEVECFQIKRAVEAQTRPAYCKAGFGRPDSGLDPIQRRICYVVGAP